MQARNRFLRILKFLGKTLLGLIFILLAFILLLHVPAIQKQIAPRLSAYLTSKVGARIDIHQISFSLGGSLVVRDTEIWDPEGKKMLSAGNLSIKTNFLDLLRGIYIFDEIQVEDVDARLSQDEDGVNFDYILDAFSSGQEKDPVKKVRAFLCRRISFQNIDVEYRSGADSLNIDLVLEKFMAKEVLLSLNPDKIKANWVSVDQAIVSILSDDLPGEKTPSPPSADSIIHFPVFYPGIDVEIHSLGLNRSSFAFHRQQVAITPTFDPAHLVVKDFQTHLMGLLLRKDSLAVEVGSFSGQMPGFEIARGNWKVEMNSQRLSLPWFYLKSGLSEVTVNGDAWYNQNAPDAAEKWNGELYTDLELDREDASYFFPELISKYAGPLKKVGLTLSGKYEEGRGKLDLLSLKTAKSWVSAKGVISNIGSMEYLSWKDLLIESSINTDVTSALQAFAVDIQIPPEINFSMNSTGNLRSVLLDGEMKTPWGNVSVNGMVSPKENDLNLDMKIAGTHIQPVHWVDFPWLRQVDFAIDVKGIVGDHQDAKINGVVNSIEFSDQSVHGIDVVCRILKDSVIAAISIKDPNYLSEAYTEVSFAGPLLINAELHLNEFSLGRLLQLDSTLNISGEFNSNLIIDRASIQGRVAGDSMSIQNHFSSYVMDSMRFTALVSPDSSYVSCVTDNAKGVIEGNFDLKALSGIIPLWTKSIIKPRDTSPTVPGIRKLRFEFELDNAAPLLLAGLALDDFSTVMMTGEWDEQKQALDVQATSGRFEGYGVSLDTFYLKLGILANQLNGGLHGKNLLYNTFELGDLDADILSAGDTVVSSFLLVKDALSLLGLQARILSTDTAVIVYPDQLLALGKDFNLDRKNRVLIRNGNVEWDQFRLEHDAMQMSLDGDLQAFDVHFKDVDLTTLNSLWSPDSAILDHGNMTGMISYIQDQHLKVEGQIDSLILYHSLPLTIALSAAQKDRDIPFQFLLSNATNHVDVRGNYFPENGEVDAAMSMDVQNLELFSFLTSGVLDEMKGGLKGKATVTGLLQQPEVSGDLTFLDARFTTSNPKFTFNVPDSKVRVDSSKFYFDHFLLYDKRQHPLTLSGYIGTPDFESYMYDLKFSTGKFALLDIPATSKEKVKGLLEVAADIALTGNEKDTYINASITIQDSTHLTYELSGDDDALLKTEGIVMFVDPGQVVDSAALTQPASLYDSLITSLPDFNLSSKILIADQAKLRVITNAQSGDYFEVSGGANLELGYDRTGNAHLAGTYSVNSGVYRISFYDLVRKDFLFVPGSSITWSGSPESGELDIKAVYTVSSNSIGLIGHEIGENEKSVYKRSLNYEVGVNIRGTIEKPIVSFSLDLPGEEKANYPVLANKLDRLRQPEFQSELNKQVFGLLVLGGFLPDASLADVNSNQIATTALYNSVNSLLSSQLNRFAGQYIKGVNIDVGIQSYSDYSTPGGKTQTAMDFRVSKSILDDRLSFEVGGDFDIQSDQSGANTGNNYRGDVAIIYDLTGNGDKQLKLFNNETYDIIYQEIRNTGISLIFIREFNKGERKMRGAE